VKAVCDYVRDRIIFSYSHASPTKTAFDVPPRDSAMDFSVWFEVYLGGR
jgi:hypothetical protein